MAKIWHVYVWYSPKHQHARGRKALIWDSSGAQVVGNSVLIGVFILCFNGTCYALFSPAL